MAVAADVAPPPADDVDLSTLTEVGVIPTTAQGVIGGWGTPESGSSGVIFTKFALSPDDATILLPDRANARVTL